MRSLVRLSRHVATLVLITLTMTCTHTNRRPPSQVRGPTSSASIITRAEIDSLMRQNQTAYDLIGTARPQMLVSRDVRLPGPVREGLVSDPTGVKVFVDEIYVGGVEMLRRIPSRSILFVQHLSPSEATTRYGSGMVAGVIVVTTGTRWR